MVLPEAWVAANDTTLRSLVFSSVFHGFALAPASGNAVVGFGRNGGALRVFTDRDTSDFPLARTLTGLERDDATAAIPPDRILVQDGSGPGVAFDFDFDADALANTALNGGFVRLVADTAAVKDTPPGFVRPLLRRLQLVAVEEDSSIFLLSTASLGQDGIYRFETPPSAAALSFRGLVERLFFGSRLYDHFELRFPFDAHTLDAVLLYGTATDDATAPRAVLTFTAPDR